MLSTKSNDKLRRSGSVPKKGTPYFFAKKSARPRVDTLREPFFQHTPTASSIASFRRIIWSFYKANGRHELPWRKTRDPYEILVSEVMLQQTQVERVVPFYKNFLEKFSTVQALAEASLGEVLRAWQGLGYNRRAKMLHAAAKEIVLKHTGKFPKTVEELEKLPGIGPYTARAVAAFAYNQPVVFVETNLRTVVTHHFFQDREKVDDKEVLEVLAKAFPKPTTERGAREWYAALMDYGAHLKRSGVRLNAKSKTYTKQSQFTGSDREARGAILKELAKGPQTISRLTKLLGDNRTDQIKTQIEKLLSEGLVQRQRLTLRLPD